MLFCHACLIFQCLGGGKKFRKHSFINSENIEKDEKYGNVGRLVWLVTQMTQRAQIFFEHGFHESTRILTHLYIHVSKRKQKTKQLPCQHVCLQHYKI